MSRHLAFVGALMLTLTVVAVGTETVEHANATPGKSVALADERDGFGWG
ncbi:hypothetical protein [Streptomyces albospinus]|nr:hypothetical protein [Streptomyces albospinus]